MAGKDKVVTKHVMIIHMDQTVAGAVVTAVTTRLVMFGQVYVGMVVSLAGVENSVMNHVQRSRLVLIVWDGVVTVDRTRSVI